MKKIDVIGIFLLLSSLSFGQQYLPIVEEGKYWILNQYNNDDVNPDVISAYAITIIGDSLYDGQNYKKVYRFNLAGTHPCQTPPCFTVEVPYRAIDQQLIALVREELVSKKVYALSLETWDGFCETKEYLLLDYDLEVRDTLNDCVFTAIGGGNLMGGATYTGLVDSMVSINAYNKLRNTIFTTGYMTYLGLPPVGPIQIIEGIGLENYGIFHQWKSQLIDFCENGMEACAILTSVSTVMKNGGRVQIYPNPVREWLTVFTDNNIQVQKISIYSVTGKLIEEVYGSQDIDMSRWTNGIYFINVLDKQGKQYIKKVVKED